MIDYNKFVKGSRNFLKNYIIDNKLESCVLGISGGIDSTISACIASTVCKELNIPLIGRSLPTGTNEQIECNVADLVGNAFCTDYKVVALDRTYFSIVNKFEENEGFINNIQSGNIKARLRMIYLRHVASIHKGVVLDNDNFTEWNLGFWTVGGDSPMDVNLGLHYLWKTEIYELAGYLEKYYHLCSLNNIEPENKWKAIYESIKLIPTDGNGVSKSDCEQFGLNNYLEVDDVLHTMYYSHYPNSIRALSKDDINKEYIRLIDSYNKQGVDKVMMLHQNTEYKRKPTPIIPTPEELELLPTKNKFKDF